MRMLKHARKLFAAALLAGAGLAACARQTRHASSAIGDDAISPSSYSVYNHNTTRHKQRNDSTMLRSLAG